MRAPRPRAANRKVAPPSGTVCVGPEGFEGIEGWDGCEGFEGWDGCEGCEGCEGRDGSEGSEGKLGGVAIAAEIPNPRPRATVSRSVFIVFIVLCCAG